MVEANASTAGRLARMGMPLITPSQGLAALVSTLSQLHWGTCLSQLAALPLDATALLAHGNLPAMTVPLIADLVTSEQPSSPETLQAPMDPAVVTPARPSHSMQQTLATVSSVVSGILGFSVPPTTPLMAAGLDSLASVEVTNALQVELGMPLPPTLVSLGSTHTHTHTHSRLCTHQQQLLFCLDLVLVKSAWTKVCLEGKDYHRTHLAYVGMLTMYLYYC